MNLVNACLSQRRPVDLVQNFNDETGVITSDDGYGAAFGALLTSDEPESRAVAVAMRGRVEILLPSTDGLALQVLRDGLKLYDGEPVESFVDASASEGASYLYESSLSREVPRERWPGLLSDGELEAVISGNMPVPQEATTWGIPVTVPTANTFAAASSAVSIAAAAIPAQTTFRYRAFIADAYAPAPAIACTPTSGEYRFKGDNRTWSPSAGTHRVQATAGFNWDSSSIALSKFTGTTVRQKKNSGGIWVDGSSLNAGTSGITLTKKAMSTSNGRLYMKINVANPMCNSLVSLPIYAELQIEVLRSGSYSILSGTRRPVLHHEAYLRKDSAVAWTAILSRTNSGFECLAAVNLCPYDSLVKNGSY